MYDDVLEPLDPGFAEVGRRLEAFADLRLTPRLSATTRMRTVVMNHAHRRAGLLAADAAFGVPSAALAAIEARNRSPRRSAWHRPAAAAMAACMTLSILAGTVAASSPGGPLYEARIWVEAANLPKAASARAEAQMARLELRIDEAQLAATHRDAAATAAALMAYASILREAETAVLASADPAIRGLIGATAKRCLATLSGLADGVPSSARAALQNALAASAAAIADLDPDARSRSVGAATGPAAEPGLTSVGRQKDEAWSNGATKGGPMPQDRPDESNPGNGREVKGRHRPGAGGQPPGGSRESDAGAGQGAPPTSNGPKGS